MLERVSDTENVIRNKTNPLLELRNPPVILCWNPAHPPPDRICCLLTTGRDDGGAVGETTTTHHQSEQACPAAAARILQPLPVLVYESRTNPVRWTLACLFFVMLLFISSVLCLVAAAAAASHPFLTPIPRKEQLAAMILEQLAAMIY